MSDSCNQCTGFLVLNSRSKRQGDHLSGKPENVGEFETCQGNVRGLVIS